MKQKQRKHLYKANHRSAPTMRMWLMLVKAWRYEYQLNFGIVKHRHRRSIRYTDMMALIGDDDNYRFTREAKTIGRKKHGKWLYTPKRVILRGNKNDKKPIFI